MSQQKTLTNLGKAKLLRELRRRLGWPQQRMADALGLDSTYLSQLENDRRPIDDWYIARAEEIAAGFEKSKEVKPTMTAPAPSRQGCEEYLGRFLDTCDDPAKLGWAIVELQEHFPLNKWSRERSDPPAYRPSSEPAAELAKASMAAAEAAAGLAPGSLPSPATGAPSGHKRGPARGTGRRSASPSAPPKPARAGHES